MPSSSLGWRVHTYVIQHLNRLGNKSPCISQVWRREGDVKLRPVTASWVTGCQTPAKVSASTHGRGKKAWLAQGIEPNRHVKWITWDHRTVDEFEANTEEYWLNPPNMSKHESLVRNISMSGSNTGLRRKAGSWHEVLSHCKSAVKLELVHLSHQILPNWSNTTCKLKIIHRNYSLRDATVFWPLKGEVKATASSLHGLGVFRNTW